MFVLMAIIVSLTANAAPPKVSVNVKDAPLRQVIDGIEKNYGYAFVYKSGLFDMGRKVTVNVTNQPVEKALESMFAGMPVEWEVNNNQIALRPGAVRSAVKKVEEKAKTHAVTGMVTDKTTGEPLIGVTVVSKKGKNGVITDIEGNYRIDVRPNDELTFTYVGYTGQTLTTGDLGVLNVEMLPDDQMLSEVVVVGAGKQSKISVTGSVTSVKGDLLRAPSSSLTSNFAGKLAGVISSTSSGEPGSVSEFYIRGVGTFGGRATPLILLDDVEISSTDLNRLPAESIESFSILKDASATAIYGARGANGVMIITTKKGMENTRAKINVAVEFSILNPVNRVEYVDGPTWMSMYNEALASRTASAQPRYTQETIRATAEGLNPYVYPNVDWYDLMFKKQTFNQRANVNLTGGGSKVTYYMGLQVNHDAGMLKIPKTYSFDANINDWNYIFQNNLCYKPTSSTTIDMHLNAQFGNRKGPGMSMTDIFNSVYNANPVSFPAVFPAEDGDDHLRFGNSYQTADRLNINPYAQMMSSYGETTYSTISASLRATQQLDFITQGLSATVLVNLKSYASSDYINTIEPYYYQVMENTWEATDPDFFLTRMLRKGTDYIAQGGINRFNDRTFYLDARINYARRFGDHDISAMLMYMQREYRSDVLPNRNQGFSGRVTYNYDYRYFAEVNFGYNGTERLAKGKRFELFPAVSLGWVVSNEKFWESAAHVVDHLKIRGSYGLVGSDETGLMAGAAHFLYKNEVAIGGGGYYSTGPYVGSETTKRGPGFLKYAVENAGWERAKKFDIGLDIRLFNQVDITVDYFTDHRDRILQKRSSWPAMLGYDSAMPWGNVGKVSNKGVELSVNWLKRITNDLSVDVRANLTYTENKYVYNDEPAYPYVWQTLTGKPLSATFGYIADGLFTSQEEIDNHANQLGLGSTTMPGDIKYRDVNGDGIINSDDRVMLSKYGLTPRLQYGFGVNVVWKGFDFGVFFNGSGCRTMMVNNIAPFCSDDGNQDRNVMKFVADNYWSASNPNPDAAYPRLGVSNSQVAGNMVESSYWMRDGSFLRFKTLELGYTYKFVRVYFSGDNLFVWSPFKYWDPELSYYSYPLSRTFNIGAQFNF